MAHPNYNHYPQTAQSLPPVQTQHHAQSQRSFSPSSYQQSPGAMSPTAAGIPPAKRQRLSPNPPSPYQSPFPPPSPYASSPYSASPPSQYLNLPQSPAAMQPSHAFHQPQPYQQANADQRPHAQGSMPPPKLPYSKTAQDNTELEKANARDMDVNNISDVLTGSGIDLRAEEDNLMLFNRERSFHSQPTEAIASPQGSFDWSQQSQHGAFRGTGPLSQPVTEEQLEKELQRKHERAARIYNETAQNPLSNPFLFASLLRQRVAKRAYEQGVTVNLDGLFDKIPSAPQNVTRTEANGADGESIVGLQAASLLNQGTPFVEVLALLSLATEQRVRTALEDSFALCQGRQHHSHGIIPPHLVDIAVTEKDARPVNAPAVNVSKTPWDVPDSAVSPMTNTANKQPPSAGRLPTPPSEAPGPPRPTLQLSNHVATALRKRVLDDESYEKERIRRRKKRAQGNSTTPADTPTVAPLPPPEKITKKELNRLKKGDQTEDSLHRKANETASMALGGKKKYSWMTGGGGGGGGGLGSGTSTPRVNTNVGAASGTATPAQPQQDRALTARKRNYGALLDTTEMGERIQMRDLIHVLEHDRNEKKTLMTILARIKNTEKDEKTRQNNTNNTNSAR